MRIEPFQSDFSVEDLIIKMGGSIIDSDTMDASSYGIPTKNLSISYPKTISELKLASQSGIKKPKHNKDNWTMDDGKETRIPIPTTSKNGHNKITILASCSH